MERALTPVRIEDARAAIARGWLAGDEAAPERAGAITLKAHQREAVARVRATMAEFGGALLADAVGLGKTFVAVAVVREIGDALIVCPAALRDMWRRALREAGAVARVCTYSELSRGREPSPPAALLVLDEAHHARTPSTRRYQVLARLAARTRVLALSATPIHNARDDLAALLALFLGARAWTMSDAELARCVVRREHADVESAKLPALAPLQWVPIAEDGALLRALVELPPPVPLAGGGDGGALITLGLVRQWASSRAALEGALRRRLARAAGLGAALESGFHPTPADLRAWTAADDCVQLAFPSIVAAPSAEPAPLLRALRAHERALRDVLARSRASDAADASRAERLREIRHRHPDAKIVAFSQFGDTVHALFRRLVPDGRVAALTARGARVAGGALTRRDALERFAPRAMGVPPPPAAERIDLLLTTDLLSEGLDLGDAAVVVHLDLPWTPARMEQRVGRSCRLGAPHERTESYAFSPPAETEMLVAIERRLRAKLAACGRMTGIAGAILPDTAITHPEAMSATALRERIRRLIATWERDGPASQPIAPLAATARGTSHVVLALIEHDGRPLLAAASDGRAMSSDPAIVAPALGEITAAVDARLDRGALAHAATVTSEFLERLRADAAVGGAEFFRASARRLALRRITAITRRAPLHRRALLAPLASAAREVITAPFGLGAEEVLGEIAAAPLTDEAWLRALAQFGAIHAPARTATGTAGTSRLLVLIVVSPA